MKRREAPKTPNALGMSAAGEDAENAERWGKSLGCLWGKIIWGSQETRNVGDADGGRRKIG
jgi:hypothetical protein